METDETFSSDEIAPPAWQSRQQDDLALAIAEFKATLPGWWYSVCECQFSCDASCAPTRESDDIKLIAQNEAFDSGFHVELEQPSSLAEALRDVLAQALAVKAALNPEGSET